MSARRLALAALLALGSCAKSLDDLGSFPCAEDDRCPDGWTCRAGTCSRQGGLGSPDGGGGTPTRECESDRDCPASQFCFGGQTASKCLVPCTGAPDECNTGFDCKLFPGIRGDKFVPVCARTGTGKGACESPLDCAAGYSCARWQFSTDYLCREQCNPYHQTCDQYGKFCQNGSATYYPDLWGYCN